jgi:hypothetical protein
MPGSRARGAAEIDGAPDNSENMSSGYGGSAAQAASANIGPKP